MNWKFLSNIKSFGFLLSILPFFTQGRVNQTDSCSGITSIASSYLQNAFGATTTLPWHTYDGRDLEICSRPLGHSCCSRKHEKVFMANAVKFISRFWPKPLGDVILAQSSKIAEQVTDLLAKTQEKIRYRMSHIYRAPESEYRAALSSLFAKLALTSNFSESSLETERHFESFFIELFPLVFVNQMGGDSSSGSFRSCLKSNYNKFRPKPFLNLPAEYGRHLHTILSAYRLLLQTLRFSARLIDATTTSSVSLPCLRGLIRVRLCYLCAGQNVSRPCAGPCLNVHRGCFAHLLPLRRNWADFMRRARELIDAINGASDNLIFSLNQFESTILKASQKAMFNVGKYGKQVVFHCTKPGNFPGQNKNRSSTQGSRRVTVPSGQREPEIADPDLQPRLAVIRELLTNNEAFFDNLPDQFCKGLLNRGCWNGTHQSPGGYMRPVWRFSDREQANNMEVQRQAPASFPDSEVERQRVRLVETAKKIVLFTTSRLIKPDPPVPPKPQRPLPTAPRRPPLSQLPEGSGSGLGPHFPPKMPPRRVRINAPDDDDLVWLSGSGSVQKSNPTHLPVDLVPAPGRPTYDSSPRLASARPCPFGLSVALLSLLVRILSL